MCSCGRPAFLAAINFICQRISRSTVPAVCSIDVCHCLSKATFTLSSTSVNESRPCSPTPAARNTSDSARKSLARLNERIKESKEAVGCMPNQVEIPGLPKSRCGIRRPGARCNSACSSGLIMTIHDQGGAISSNNVVDFNSPTSQVKSPVSLTKISLRQSASCSPG